MPSISDIRWPLASNTIKRGTMATFGMVRTALNSQGQLVPAAHQGWDLFAVPNTPCFAVADGTVRQIVTTCVNGPNGHFGKLLVLELTGIIHDGKPVFAVYCHLTGFAPGVAAEVTVTKGQLICYSGNTGNAYNMAGIHRHLHFEFRNRHPLPPGKTGLNYRIDPKDIYGSPPLNTIHTEA